MKKEIPDSPPERSRLSDADQLGFCQPDITESHAPKSPTIKSEKSDNSVNALQDDSDSIQISKSQIMRMMAEINMLKQNQMRKEAETLKEAHKEKEVITVF